MDSILRLLERPAPPEQVAALDALGIDLSKPLLPAYPVAVHAALIDYVARHRRPDLALDEAQIDLGLAFIATYNQTLMGRPLKALLWTIGPHRTLERMNRTFRTANNFTETRLERLGPTRYSLWFNFVSRPGYYQGLVHGTVAQCGVKGIEVQFSSRQGDEVTYDVSWQP